MAIDLMDDYGDQIVVFENRLLAQQMISTTHYGFCNADQAWLWTAIDGSYGS